MDPGGSSVVHALTHAAVAVRERMDTPASKIACLHDTFKHNVILRILLLLAIYYSRAGLCQ